MPIPCAYFNIASRVGHRDVDPFKTDSPNLRKNDPNLKFETLKKFILWFGTHRSTESHGY
jgi:hypothetical protein